MNFMTVALIILILIWICWACFCDPFKEYDQASCYEKRKKSMNLNWEIYKSERFNVQGNMGWRVVITDLHDNQAYTIQYSELIKFRRNYNNIKPANRDILMLATIANMPSTVAKAA